MPDLFGSDDVQEQTQDQTRQQSGERRQKTHYLQKAVYGKRPTKMALAEVIYTVSRFAFGSFEAYNAALSMYNVRADRGREDSPMYRNRGLYYRMTDDEGRKVGAPIKASDFDKSVALDKIEEHCRLSQERIQKTMRYIFSHVIYQLAGGKSLYSLNLFRRELARQKIAVVIPALKERPTRGLHRSPETPAPPDDGHGFYYVDCINLVVHDTDLGADCTAATTLRRFNMERSIRALYEQGQLQVTRPSDEVALRPGHANPAETRNAMLRLIKQHDAIVEQKLAEQQQQEQTLAMRQSYGHYL